MPGSVLVFGILKRTGWEQNGCKCDWCLAYSVGSGWETLLVAAVLVSLSALASSRPASRPVAVFGRFRPGGSQVACLY
jgi:hypothetical protein